MAVKEPSKADTRKLLNRNLAQLLKGGVIMDVTDAEQAQIAQAAGATAVMALERVPRIFAKRAALRACPIPK